MNFAEKLNLDIDTFWKDRDAWRARAGQLAEALRKEIDAGESLESSKEALAEYEKAIEGK